MESYGPVSVLVDWWAPRGNLVEPDRVTTADAAGRVARPGPLPAGTPVVVPSVRPQFDVAAPGTDRPVVADVAWPIPDGLGPALAVLAPQLAAARVVVERLPQDGTALVLDRYDAAAALVHAELRRRGDARKVVVVGPVAECELPAAAARALGAEVLPALPDDRGPMVPQLTTDDAAAAAGIGSALAILESDGWWFQPLITGAVAAAELRNGSLAAVPPGGHIQVLVRT